MSSKYGIDGGEWVWLGDKMYYGIHWAHWTLGIEVGKGVLFPNAVPRTEGRR